MAKSLSTEDVTRMILDFFLSQEYFKALIALEQDSHIRLLSYGKEIDFFYDLITEGKFDDVEKLVETVKERSTDAHSRILGYLRKQKFLESLEGAVMPEADELARVLKDIERLLPREEYESLYKILSYDHLTDHPQYAKWDIWRGRYTCFQDCLKCLSEMYSIEPPSPAPFSLIAALNGETEEGPYAETGRPLSNRQGKESARYSAEFQNLEGSEGSLVVNDPDLAEQRGGKTVKWNQKRGEAQEEGSGFREEQMSGGSNSGLIEAGNVYHRSAHDLMSNLDPTRVIEVARVTDAQPIRACVFSPTGDFYALGTNSRSLKVYPLLSIVESLLNDQLEASSDELDFVFEMENLHAGSIYCLDWSKHGSQIATGSNDKAIHIFAAPAFEDYLQEPLIFSNHRFVSGGEDVPDLKVRTIPGLPGTVRSLCFHPIDDEILFSSGSGDGEILVWQTTSAQMMRRLAGHQGGTASIAAAEDASFLISGGQDRYIRMWDLRASKCIQQINAEIFGEMNCVALNCSASSMRFDAKRKPMETMNQKLAAVAHSDGVVSVWDISAGKLFSKHNFHRESCRSVEFSSNAKWLASASFDQSIGLTSFETGDSYRITEHTGKVVSARWHPSLPLVLSTSTDKTARVFYIG